MKVDPDLVTPNKELSVRQGGIKASGWAMEGSTIASMYFEALAKQYRFSLDTPIKDLPAEIVHLLLYGTPAEDKIKIVRKNEYGSGTYYTKFWKELSTIWSDDSEKPPAIGLRKKSRAL